MHRRPTKEPNPDPGNRGGSKRDVSRLFGVIIEQGHAQKKDRQRIMGNVLHASVQKGGKKNTLQPCPFARLQTETRPFHHGALIVPEDPPKEKDDQYGNGIKTIPFLGQLIGQFGHDLKSTSRPWHHHIPTKDRLQNAAGRVF